MSDAVDRLRAAFLEMLGKNDLQMTTSPVATQ
jgi:hypothetical protein